MNILHIGCRYRPYKGGSAIRLSHIVSQWPSRLDKFHIIDEDNAEGDRSERGGSIQVWRLPYGAPTGWRRLRQYVRDWSIDVAVLHNARAALSWALFVDPLRRIPWILEIHNFRDHSYFRKAITGHLARWSDGVVVFGHAAKRLAKERYHLPPEKCIVIRNGRASPPNHDLERWRGWEPPQWWQWILQQRNGRPIIAYIGSFYPWQGIELLADAISALKPQLRQQAIFVLVGDGPSMSLVQEKLSRCVAPHGSVVLTGWVEARMAAGITDIADCVVLPRLSTLGTETIVPLKAIDVLDRRKPCVASSVGGLVEALDPLGEQQQSFIAPGSLKELREALEGLIALGVGSQGTKVLDPRKYRPAAELFGTWADVAQQYRRYFEAIISP